jgi:hypothetical protein
MTDLPDEDTVRRRRRTFDDGTEPDTVPVDGSTVIARRESRRRSTREGAGARRVRPAPPAPAESGRTAAAPGAACASVYGARPADPVVVARTAPPAHPPQEPVDGAAAAAAERRRARRTALVVLLAASAVAVGATAALLAVVLSP